jgi:Tol biopolymer transport system component
MGVGVVVVVVAGLLAAFGSSGAVAAESCANAAVRLQTASTGLPDCRAYEMVSPPYKQGFPVTLDLPLFTDDGVVSYRSLGAFAGNSIASASNLYHATRSATAWVTTSMDPPASVYDTSLGENPSSVSSESPDLRWSLWRMYRRDTETGADVGFWLRGPDGVFTRIGDGLFTWGGSAGDFSHVIVGFADLGEYVGTGHSGPPRLASVGNDGQSLGTPCLREMSPDGRVIVFGVGCVGGDSSKLWARVGGSATVAVSGSECTRQAGDPEGACNGASGVTYAGGAADGSRVFFTTSQQLVNGDVDQSSDVYACDIPVGAPAPVGLANSCDSLTEVSGARSEALVENVVSVSEDGSRVFFVAQGVLADNLDVSGVGALAGAENLYVWDRDPGHPAGQIRYVARLRGGNDLTRAQMTPDGRYLLFVTANRLEPGDADDVRDVYRYDAQTSTMVRLSASVAGGGGNGQGFDVSIPNGPAMSADGSTVIFDTAEALSISDTNGVDDVYSWRDGQVSLISAGGGTAVGVTPSGRDLFFRTAAQVLSADSDANADLYDARLGGGFAPDQTPPPCSGDECRGQRSRPPSLAGPSAVGLGGGVAEVVPVFSVRALSLAQRRALAATGKVSLTVISNTPGTITGKATATIGGRSVKAGSGRRTLRAAGRVAVALTLSKKARAQLVSRGRLTVKVAVTHSKVALDRSLTLKLVHAKKKAKRSQRTVAGVVGGRS